MLLAVLTLTSTAASLRLRGVGPALGGFVDDQANDLLDYPQLNSLSPDWLAGVEMRWDNNFYVFASTPGRTAFTGAVELRYDGFVHPAAAVARSAGSWCFGASVAAIDPVWTFPCGERSGSGWRWAKATWWDVANGVLGGRWTGHGLSLDVTVDALVGRAMSWRGVQLDTFAQSGDFTEMPLTPALRLTIPRGRICWRIVGLCENALHLYRENYYNGADTTIHLPLLLVQFRPRRLTLAGGLTYLPDENLMVAAAPQASVYPGGEFPSRIILPVGLGISGTSTLTRYG